MSITDPISNMLAKIRNANTAGKKSLEIKSSRMNQGILDILKKEKFIQNFKLMPDQKQGTIRVYLKFDDGGAPAINGLKRISRPGLRVYTNSREIRSVLNGLGIAIISTSQGLMTDNEAREKRLGGEVLCWVW